MISIPTGFLSFAKSPTLQNLRGMPDTRPMIHSFVDRLSHMIDCPLCVVSTSKEMNSLYLRVLNRFV